MKDMIGQTLNVGDIFIIPGGNARYGGLVLEAGIILSFTEKRLKALVTRLDKINLKPTTKTPAKVFKLNLNKDNFLNNENLGELELLYNHKALVALQESFTKERPVE